MSRSVCFVGAGPCTLSALHFLAQDEALKEWEVIVYEKQSAIGGMWQSEGNWRVGVDEYGMPVHHSMYKDLWSNGPKECLEVPDWTFEDCFKRNIPSFPPRAILAEYITSRAENDDILKYVHLNTVVHQITYNDATAKFTVETEDLRSRTASERTFDYVVVASGHFSTPNTPTFPGIETFQGRVLHAHDYRNGYEFRGQDILVIGSSYSAEDITLQTLKFGAKSVSVSYRTNKMGFNNWPESFKGQHPLISNISGRKVTFVDDSSAEFDAILFCTGYKHYFPFISPNLRLQTYNQLYPPLYKGVVFPSNPKMLYMGMQDLYYTFTLFDMQGLWIIQYLTGKQPVVSQIEMEKDIAAWQTRQNEELPEGVTHWKHGIDLQSDYVNDLAKLTNYPHNLDCREMFYEWEEDKHNNIVTYRDKQFTSMFTKVQSPLHHTQWWHAFDDSKETFFNQPENGNGSK